MAQGKALSPQLVQAPGLRTGLFYRSVVGQGATLAYIETFILLTIAASMNVPAFLLRSQERSQGWRRSSCGLANLFGEDVK